MKNPARQQRHSTSFYAILIVYISLALADRETDIKADAAKGNSICKNQLFVFCCSTAEPNPGLIPR